MSTRFAAWLPVVLLLVLALPSCEDAAKKRAATAPPMRATAPTLTTASAQPPEKKPAAPKLQEKLQPQPDPVETLVAAVEKEYQAGQENYNAGHLEAAKQNFDRAFNMLLSGTTDVHSDERLEKEFDKIVEGTNGLEMLALKAGDGFTEQKLEPAPIDEANDVTFPVDPRVKIKAEQELKRTHSDLPLVLNDTVASYINYYSTRGRGVLERALIRAGRYREMIERILREEGVPQDLIYLAQAESGFQPLAVSRAAARGMWQFMSSRAAGYGLTHNWWLDERQDPEKSTRAAARHLRDLYNQFGDWYLAMAAYNSGPGTVQAGVQRTGYADFWELYKRGVLPKETKNYVPIILAMTIMAKNPAQYGLQDITPEPPLEVDKVTIDYPVDLRLVAECVDSSVATLQELNPGLLRFTTPRAGKFDLVLPAGTKDKFLTAIAAIPADMRTAWRYHRVAQRDTLTEIARKYHATAKAITEVNNLDGTELSPDTKLIIPVTPGRNDDGTIHYSKAITRYRVRPGDTVLSVADEWGVAPEALRRWNGLKGNRLVKGRRLIIHKPLDARNLSATELRIVSKARKSHKKGSATTAAASTENPAKNKRIRHTVRAGETLASIANRYNTSEAALRKENGKSAEHLRPGSVLVVGESR